MTIRARVLLPALLLLGLASVAQAAKVLHINAEMVRQRGAAGIHDRGSAQVVRHLQQTGHTVTTLGFTDLSRTAKTRVDLAPLGRPDLVTISATMTNSRPTVRWIVKGLVDQGHAPSRIIVGGKAMNAELAGKLGVAFGAVPTRVDGLLATRPARR